MELRSIKLIIGVWLLIGSMSLGVPSRAQTITRAEYYFDKDPGIGKGKALSVTPAGQVDIAAEVPTDGLASGFHTVFVRFQDQEGQWSLSEGRPFLIEQQQAAVDLEIVQAEYYFDKDPGIGKGKALPVTPAGQVDIAAEVPTDGLASGFHNLYIRVKDQVGRWSLSEGRLVVIDNTLSSLSKINAAEYYFDSPNPEPGKGIPLNVTPGASIEIEAQLNLGNLSIGNHRIYVRVRDDKGNWSPVESQEFTVATPRLDGITPTSGGNIGDVIVNILGASFDEGTKVKLTQSGKPDIEIPDSVTTIINGDQIQAVLDLRGKALGQYDVVVILNNGSKLSIPNGFTIVEGVEATPWAQLIGFDRIRIGQWQTYTIVVGNRGNVNAVGVPLWIALSGNTQYELDFLLTNPNDSITLDSLVKDVPIDTLFGRAFDGKVIALTIPIVPPDRTLTYTIRVKTTDSMIISAWVSDPMFNDMNIEGGRKAVTFDPITKAQVNCLLDASFEALGIVPGVGCVTGIFDHYWRPKFNSVSYDEIYEGAPIITDAVFLQWVANCIPGKFIYKASRAILSTVAKRVFRAGLHGVDKINNSVGEFNLLTSCYEAFYPSEGEPQQIIAQPIASFDPNDKLGLEGAGLKRYILGTEVFPYTIRFENKASATAAAQTVLIVDTLDANVLDISTLQLGFFSFNDVTVNIPPGRKDYIAHVDLRPANDLIVKIEAKLDEEKGILTWLYTSLDPITHKPTEDPEAGFLPPNKTAPEGEGGVFYTVSPKSGLSTSIEIKNKAYIYFDNNDVIPTPTWANSIDISEPTSNVNSLPEVQNDSSFTVSWSGADEGAGIKNFSIYIAVNNQPFKLWLENVTATSAQFTGKSDSTYHFYSIARDSTGLMELAPTYPDATTTINQVTGIVDELERQIKVYPNPAHHTVIVELPVKLRQSNLKLVSIIGNEVLSLKMNNQERISIPIQHLAKGMYLLRIQSKDMEFTKKLVIR